MRPKEASIATLKTISIDYLRSLHQGIDLGMPRPTLAIFNALAMTFPEEIRGKRQKIMAAIGALTPFFVACNDFCDIGIPLIEKRQNGCPQTRFLALLDIENRLREHLEKRKDQLLAVLEENSYAKTLVENYLQESILLAQERRQFPVSQYREYLELDMAIFAALLYGATFPKIFKQEGFQLDKSCSSLRELEEKYSFFTHPEEPLSSLKERMIGLHAINMLLKLEDDRRGTEEDQLLNTPNFVIYAQKKAENEEKTPLQILTEIKHHYYHLATSMGFSPLVIASTTALFTVTKDMKLKKCRQQTSHPFEPEDLGYFLKDGCIRELREKLNYSSILPELIHE